MLAHVSEFPVGRYKKAHRHGPGAHVFLLDSTGYTLMWQEGEKPQRYDWHEGTVISPPAGSWHQHYNTGNQPCKFVALHANTAVQGEERGVEQIEFEEGDEWMRQMFADLGYVHYQEPLTLMGDPFMGQRKTTRRGASL